MENVSERWAKKRERLLVARVLEAGFEFTRENISNIVYEAGYNIQKEKHPQDCPCYTSQPCHNDIDNLNCFVCSCPNYCLKTSDELGFIGGCRSDYGKGRYLPNPSPGKNGFGKTIWDCSECSSGHTPLSSELYLILNLEHYASLAELLKKERTDKGFADFKSFADYLSKEIMKGD